MSHPRLQPIIEAAWDQRDTLTPATRGEVREAVATALDLLDTGKARVAEKTPAGWVVHQWLKKAVLLSFRLNDMELISGAPGGAGWWDKVPSKFAGMTAEAFKQAGYRAVPGAVVRHSAYIAPGVILMPSFVNLGAYVGSGTMVDTWATVGSCAQIGADVHLAGGVGIGGVLEPVNARPVIIEDGVLVGSRCIVTEGVVVREGAVLGAGVVLTASVPVIDVTGDEPTEHRGEVPARAIVVPGVRQREFRAGTYGLPTPLIVGWRDESHDRLALNEALRDYGAAP
jgi:2,3,4,5-tetrahydropyridine-2-carboxylate N-succinyltransferase